MSLFLLRVVIFGLDDSSLPELEAYFCICLTKPLQVPAAISPHTRSSNRMTASEPSPFSQPSFASRLQTTHSKTPGSNSSLLKGVSH